MNSYSRAVEREKIKKKTLCVVTHKFYTSDCQVT